MEILNGMRPALDMQRAYYEALEKQLIIL